MFSLSVYSSETKKTLFFSNNVLHKDHEPPCFYSSFYSSPERSNQTKYCYHALYVKARVQIKLLLTKKQRQRLEMRQTCLKNPKCKPPTVISPIGYCCWIFRVLGNFLCPNSNNLTFGWERCARDDMHCFASVLIPSDWQPKDMPV